MMSPRWASALCGIVVACATVKETPRAPGVESARSGPSTPAPDPTQLTPNAPAVDAAAVIPPPEPEALEVSRVLTVPTRSIALGEGTRIAVLADIPYVGDARGSLSRPKKIAT